MTRPDSQAHEAILMHVQTKSHTCAVCLAATDEGTDAIAAWRSQKPCKQANGVEEAACRNRSSAMDVTKSYQRAQWTRDSWQIPQ